MIRPIIYIYIEDLSVPYAYFHLFHPSLGWSDGAMVLGKLPVPGRPTDLDYSRARAYCACSRCRLGVAWTFFLSSILSVIVLPLSGRRPDID